MSRTRSRSRSSTAAIQPSETTSASELARRASLGAFASLLVVTTLAPADGLPKEGLGVLVAAGALALMAGWLLAAFFASGAKRSDGRSRGIAIVAGRLELLVFVFLLLVATSALVMAREGNPRATINALWQWITFGVVFFLARQLLGSQIERRAIAVAMLGLTTGLAFYGGHQYFVELPAMRAEYRRDPEAAKRAAGVEAAPGTPLARQFEDRVLGSVEPIGTFALANSLAGVLAPWWLIAAAIGIESASRLRGRVWFSGETAAIATACLCAAVIGLCLLFTKSRSAWGGALVGALLLGIQAVRLLRLSRGKAWLALGGAALAMCLAISAAMLAGAIDAQVLSEAVKSLGYRFEYWKAALAMAGDRPLLGCGPGNFQEYYAAYKAPESSETVGDPHNWLLEVLATSGGAAALAFLGIVAVVAHRIWRGRDEEKANATSEGAPLFVLGGALMGIVLAIVHNLLLGRNLSLAAVGYCALGVVGVWFGARGWIAGGNLSPLAVAAALVAWLVHLSAAGGVSFPNVAFGGWLLAAMAIAPEAAPGVAKRTLSRGLSAIAALAGIALLGAMVYTAYRPVLEAKAFLERAERALSHQQRQIFLEQAAAADPYSPEPYRLLAILHAQRYEARGEDNEREAFQAAIHEMYARDVRSQTARRMAGDLYLNLWRQSEDGDDLAAAIKAYREAVRLYPASSFLHAQLALALDLAGERELAAREAEEALRLDGLNPHRELDLDKNYLHDGLPSDGGGPAGVLAEPRMLRLRKTR